MGKSIVPESIKANYKNCSNFYFHITVYVEEILEDLF